MELEEEIFVCLDCETTGLLATDEVIEVAIAIFNFKEILQKFESLIDPGIYISQQSISIHNITNEMVQDSPKLEKILPLICSMVGSHTIVGHNIQFDLLILFEYAKRKKIPFPIRENSFIDTFRLARLFANSPSNKLESLMEFFHIHPPNRLHRAMNDVFVTIEIFKNLSKGFRSKKEILKNLKNPIRIKTMPLGKYKGKLFSEIPTKYLCWASSQNFDPDLLFSIETEKKRRFNRRKIFQL